MAEVSPDVVVCDLRVLDLADVDLTAQREGLRIRSMLTAYESAKRRVAVFLKNKIPGLTIKVPGPPH